MSKKPSLGHNPLAYSLKNHASFDFIRDTQNKEDTGQSASSSKSKKVASYYLEEDVINHIRERANKENSSFSSIANEMLKEKIRQENNSE